MGRVIPKDTQLVSFLDHIQGTSVRNHHSFFFLLVVVKYT